MFYYEGPFSDTTTILGDSPPAPPTVPEPLPEYYPTSRFGDIDDYLAFTATAPSDSPFVGFIPRGVLEAHRWVNMSPTQRATYFAGYNPNRAYQLVPFYSQKAEIAYWLSPRWARGAGTGTLAFDPGSGHPLYQDLDLDQLPDRLDLHRRVLLIRPDLNMTLADMFAANGTAAPSPPPADWQTPTIPFPASRDDRNPNSCPARGARRKSPVSRRIYIISRSWWLVG